MRMAGVTQWRLPFASRGALALALYIGLIGVGSAADPKIEAVIRRGAEYIQRQQLQDGCWESRGHRLGETSLAGLALLAAGCPADSLSVAAAARAVRQLVATNRETYEVSLAVMFLDQVGVKNDSETIRALGGRLAAGQAANGCWTYSLVGSPGIGDNSNAQFAVLACWICRRHGAAMDDTILKADHYFRSTLNRADGGWGYTPSSHSTATMTCAGLVALAAERGMSIERSQSAPAGVRRAPGRQDGPPRDLAPDKNDPVVAAALRYLAGQLRQDRIEAQGKAFAGLYFYWSLERVGVIYGLAKIQDVDWYGWGAERLLRGQQQDGSWGGRGCVDTAFAILFLSRANVAEDLTRVLGGSDRGSQPQRQPSDTFMRVERKPRAPAGGKPPRNEKGKAD
jgi:hypothetical protein